MYVNRIIGKTSKPVVKESMTKAMTSAPPRRNIHASIRKAMNTARAMHSFHFISCGVKKADNRILRIVPAGNRPMGMSVQQRMSKNEPIRSVINAMIKSAMYTLSVPQRKTGFPVLLMICFLNVYFWKSLSERRPNSSRVNAFLFNFLAVAFRASIVSVSISYSDRSSCAEHQLLLNVLYHR